jgi:hypothetical protein
MKSFTTYALLFAIAAAGTSAATVPTGASANNNVTTAIGDPSSCYWDTGPLYPALCAGVCDSSFTQLARSKCAVGKLDCIVGDMAFCCPS